MDALGVRPPDVLTRVTEYVVQIVDFVARIVEKGLAYASNGSVYLSIDAFKQAGHTYRKLKPFSGITSEEDMAEGEGALGSEASEKRHPNDFALWKASKPGEPEWESPWGAGRPGWHIECSVIASDVLGPNLDIHAGGSDLKFPHHDNELAQSEAYYGHSQWVNYFFHAGHLYIKGLKMSKSLKNFITIQQALEAHSPQELRLMFLLQPWDKPMTYSDQTVGDATAKLQTFRNFFGTAKDLINRQGESGKAAWLEKEVGWGKSGDRSLSTSLMDTQSNVHSCLCNNFDTPGAINALVNLVTETNKYLTNNDLPAVYLLNKIAAFVTKTLKMLGLVPDEIGFGSMAGGASTEETLRPYLDALRDFRHDVRTTMRAGADKATVLGACDRVRDEVLPGLGVRLEDVSDPPSSRWKLDDPKILLKEIEEKKAAEAEAKAAKKGKEIEKARKKVADAEAAMVPPTELLKATKGADYKAFGDDGLPTQDAKGEPVAKSALKKLKKEVDTHKKKHDKLVAEATKANMPLEAYIDDLRAKLAELQA
mmetsp:Transcript_82660/g.233652  ORF Transcript_82660/g.233652 Transcript_82660/m.233652 type:complete len:538 (-) Transcript_82660:49-1662(-)